MKKILIFLAFVFEFLCVQAQKQDEYKLVWADEFDKDGPPDILPGDCNTRIVGMS